MEKMTGKSLDLVAENIEQLKKLFPEVVTEGKIDFEVLKNLLGGEIEERQEYYKFTWNGKEAARAYARTPSMGTLRPCVEESSGKDGTPGKFDSENLYIEGDNLEVLKLLQGPYHKRIKMIYIDPPYNTGKDFVYPDNYRDSISNYKALTGQTNEEGKTTRANPETSGRYHTDWLNMMYPRLVLARNLLTDDGAIFISIDNSEVDNLKKLCNEVFGEENFVASLVWKKKTGAGTGIKNVFDEHEYVLVFCKSLDALPSWRIHSETDGNFTNPDNDPKGEWESCALTAPSKNRNPNQLYLIEVHYDHCLQRIAPCEDDRQYIDDFMYGNHHIVLRRVKNDQEQEYTFFDPQKNTAFFIRRWAYASQNIKTVFDQKKVYLKDKNIPRLKKYKSEYEGKALRSIYFDDFSTQQGTEMLRYLFDGQNLLEYPKPVELISHLIRGTNVNSGIVLDFFSGSATTAHAVLQLNAEDCCNRKFIMVQLPEVCAEETEAAKAGYKNICEIGKERIRRAAKKIKEENPLFAGDMGFKVFKLDTSNIIPWNPDPDNIELTMRNAVENMIADRTRQDLLYEVLLKCNLPLTLPIEARKFGNNTVYVVGAGALAICLDITIPQTIAEEIVKLRDEFAPVVPMRVVFRDNGFTDVSKTNALQILKQAGFEEKSIQTI